MIVTQERFRKNNFNLIQFIMAILVIYSHAFPIASAQNNGELIMDLTASRYSFGSLAVAVFFIISGYLVSSSYENSTSVLQYFKKRIFRIFPGLFAVLTLSALVMGPLVTSLSVKEYFAHPNTWEHIKSIQLYPLSFNLPGVFENNLYSSSVNGSLWTVPYQFGFYILLGIVGFLGLNKRRGISLALFAFFVYAHLMKSNLFPNTTHFWQMPLDSWLYLGMYFTAGMAAYSYRDIIRLNRPGAMIALTMLSFAWVAKEFYISTTIFGTYLILYLAYCTKPIHFPLAKLSFGVYIYAFPIQQLITHLFGGSMNPYVNMLISIPGSVLLAFLSDKLIESPIQKFEKVLTLRKLIPKAVFELWNKVYARYLHLLDRISTMSWISYFVTVLASIAIGWVLFINLPSSLDFKNHAPVPERVFGLGCYTQSKDESFMYVSQKATFNMGQGKGMNTVEIIGFLPSSYTDVQWVSVYFNGTKILTEAPITAGQGFHLQLPITENTSLIEKTATITLEFNAVHQKSPESKDVRELSACIQSISFVQAP